MPIRQGPRRQFLIQGKESPVFKNLVGMVATPGKSSGKERARGGFWATGHMCGISCLDAGYTVGSLCDNS